MTFTSNNCPNCDYGILLQVEANHFYTCHNCSLAYLVNDNLQVSKNKLHSEVNSLININNIGTFNNLSFKVTGTLVLFNSFKVNLIHYLKFNNGEPKLLIEDDYNYYIVDKKLDLNYSDIKSSTIGKVIKIKNLEQMICTQLDKVQRFAITGTGSLLLPNLINSAWACYLSPELKNFYLLGNKDKIMLFSVTSLKYQELNFQQVR